MNHFPELRTDKMDRLIYATDLMRGDACTWWHLVHNDFHADPSAFWVDSRKVFLSQWQVVLPERTI